MNVGTSSSPTTTRSTCPKCSYKNRLGTLFCEECGTPINISARSVTTVTNSVPDELKQRLAGMSNLASAAADDDTLTAKPDLKTTQNLDNRRRSCLFVEGATLMLEVEGIIKPIILTVPQNKALVIGRKDEKYIPHIDMMPYGGQTHGLSRRHAALKLRRKRLDVVDLNSSNGTFINEDKLDPGDPNQLRDGDVLRLGRLKITVRFHNA